MYSQALNDTGFDPGYLRNLKYVCSRVELSLRSDKLTFSHHTLVAPCDPADQKKWLTLAANNHWTVKELREAMQAENGEDQGDVEDSEGGDDLVEVMHDIEVYLNTLESDSERLAAVKGLERRMKKLEKRYGGAS